MSTCLHSEMGLGYSVHSLCVGSKVEKEREI